MRFNPNKHNRRSIRLRGYDYTAPGAYFITICTKNRVYLFGTVVDEVMQLNDAGQMVERWWGEVANKFPTIELDAFVVMPSHFHAIVAITNAHCDALDAGNHTGLPLHNVTDATNDRDVRPTLADVIHWFKTMTTNEYIRGVHDLGWSPFDRRLWHRHYYEPIVRDAAELARIRIYIEGNPARWATDQLRTTA